MRLGGTDISDNAQGTPLTKGAEGVWEGTLGLLASGAYRYTFSVDGVAVIDPRNPATSGSNENTGKDDFVVETSRATVEMLKKHGFDVVYKETAGGHTWANWRDSLAELAPQLFR